MKKYFQNFFKRSNESYDYNRLIGYKLMKAFDGEKDLEHIISDIDKTYLETEFESVSKMIRIAFEKPLQKKTVKGAAELFRALRYCGLDPKVRPVRPLHFVSSSPPQLRSTLREKFCYDGLDWNSDTFKNQVYNLLRIRMDQLRQHIAYKSAALLNVMSRSRSGSKFYLIGDNVEFDAYIYIGVGLYVSGALTDDGYVEWLKNAGVEEYIAKKIVLDSKISDVTVQGVYIRKVQGHFLNTDSSLANPIKLFNNFFELSLFFIRDGLLPISMIEELVRVFLNRHQLQRPYIAESFARVFAYEDLQDLELDAFIDKIKKISSGSIAMPEVASNSMAELQKLDEAAILEESQKWVQCFPLRVKESKKKVV